MASHFSSIGFPIQDQDEYLAIANQAGPLATPHEVEQGTYWQWSCESGAELWLQVDAENEFVGMTPFFSGSSRLRIAITKAISRPEDTPLDGAIHGWANPPGDSCESGDYPLVVDVVDLHRRQALTLPCVVTMQMAAFAHEIEIFSSQEDYDASKAGQIKFASKSFIPAGLFTPDGSQTEHPEAIAIFTGHVLAAEVKQNSLTGHDFYWAHVESLGGPFDVIIDPELCDSPPPIGGIISGTFWLCGRMVE